MLAISDRTNASVHGVVLSRVGSTRWRFSTKGEKEGRTEDTVRRARDFHVGSSWLAHLTDTTFLLLLLLLLSAHTRLAPAPLPACQPCGVPWTHGFGTGAARRPRSPGCSLPLLANVGDVGLVVVVCAGCALACGARGSTPLRAARRTPRQPQARFGPLSRPLLCCLCSARRPSRSQQQNKPARRPQHHRGSEKPPRKGARLVVEGVPVLSCCLGVCCCPKRQYAAQRMAPARGSRRRQLLCECAPLVVLTRLCTYLLSPPHLLRHHNGTQHQRLPGAAHALSAQRAARELLRLAPHRTRHQQCVVLF